MLVSTGAQSENKDIPTKFTKIYAKTIMKPVSKKVNLSLKRHTRTQTIHRKKKKRTTKDQYGHAIIFNLISML